MVNETQSSAALLRGMLAAYDGAGGTLRGFDLATCSEVPAGCGLSSSAAFEVMVGAVLEGLFGPGPFAGRASAGAGQDAAEGEGDCFVPLNPVALALAGVTAEQRYLGKPCGAQDGQCLRRHGAARFCVGGAPGDAACLRRDGRWLRRGAHRFAPGPLGAHRGVRLRTRRHAHGGPPTWASRVWGDDRRRAAREPAGCSRGAGRRARHAALHYFDEVARVDRQREALEAGDFPLFLKCVRLSGASSAQFLQNVSLA